MTMPFSCETVRVCVRTISCQFDTLHKRYRENLRLKHLNLEFSKFLQFDLRNADLSDSSRSVNDDNSQVLY